MYLPRVSCIVSLVAVSVAACSTPTTPQVPVVATDLKSSLSASFDAMVIPAGAACSVSISQHGQVVLERGRGQVAPGRPANEDSLYRIASLTKPITASAVLVSEQAGRLARTDTLGRFFDYAAPAPTLDELIKHLPGLSNFTDLPIYQGEKSTPISLEKLLSLIQPWDGVYKKQYSNSHYAYLGAVLQKVNGLSYDQILQRDIFGPAGMTRSSLEPPPASESVGFPSPSLTHPSWPFAAGAVTSTAADLNRFNQSLLSNRFGFGAVDSFDRSAGVTSFGMGSGVTNGDLRFTHSGQLDSYTSYSVLFPADRSSVVVLCNAVVPNLSTFVFGPNGVRLTLLNF